MGLLTKARVSTTPTGAIPQMSFPLAAAAPAAWEGGIACFDSARPGFVYPYAVSVNTMSPIGWFSESVDNSAGGSTVPVGVKLNREIQLSYWDSVTGGGAVTVANLGTNVYLASDHEVTTTAGAQSHSGRVWLVRADGQVGVEFPF